MLVVETSVWVAMVLRAASHHSLIRTLLQASEIGIAAPNLAEAVLVVESREGTEGIRVLEGLLMRFGARVLS